MRRRDWPANIKTIDAALDLGNGLTMAAFSASMTTIQTNLSEYNQTLASVDDRLNALVASEKVGVDLSERILARIAARYGKDSSEYEQAGGVRKSERKRPSRKNKTPPVTGTGVLVCWYAECRKSDEEARAKMGLERMACSPG